MREHRVDYSNLSDIVRIPRRRSQERVIHEDDQRKMRRSSSSSFSSLSGDPEHNSEWDSREERHRTRARNKSLYNNSDSPPHYHHHHRQMPGSHSTRDNYSQKRRVDHLAMKRSYRQSGGHHHHQQQPGYRRTIKNFREKIEYQRRVLDISRRSKKIIPTITIPTITRTIYNGTPGRIHSYDEDEQDPSDMMMTIDSHLLPSTEDDDGQEINNHDMVDSSGEEGDLIIDLDRPPNTEDQDQDDDDLGDNLTITIKNPSIPSSSVVPLTITTSTAPPITSPETTPTTTDLDEPFDDPRDSIEDCKLYIETGQFLESQLINTIYQIFLQKSLSTAPLDHLGKFDLFYLDYQSRVGLAGHFKILLKTCSARESFTVQCDLRTVLETLWRNPKFSELKTSPHPDQLWMEEMKILFREGEETVGEIMERPIIERSFLDCVDGSILHKGQLWTRSHGSWTTDSHKPAQALQIHLWFLKFLRQALYSPTDVQLDLTNLITSAPSTTEEGETLILFKQMVQAIFLPPSSPPPVSSSSSADFPVDDCRYDFVEIKPTGEISFFFMCPNFSRLTNPTTTKIQSCAKFIAAHGFQHFYDTYHADFDPKAHDDPNMDDGEILHMTAQRHYFQTLYKDYDVFLEAVKNARLVYLLIRPSNGNGRFYFEQQLVTKLNEKTIVDWLMSRPPGHHRSISSSSSSGKQKQLTLEEKRMFHHRSICMKKTGQCNAESTYHVDSCLANVIFEELKRQRFVDEQGIITLKSLYVQREEFKFDPIQKLTRRRGDMSTRLDAIEKKIFKVFKLVKSNFSRDEPKFDLRQAWMGIERLKSQDCHFQLKVMEMREDFRGATSTKIQDTE